MTMNRATISVDHRRAMAVAAGGGQRASGLIVALVLASCGDPTPPAPASGGQLALLSPVAAEIGRASCRERV